MKKLTYFIPAFLMVIFSAGCSGSGDNSTTEDSLATDSVTASEIMSQSEADSLAGLLGQLFGNDVLKYKASDSQKDKPFDSEEYIKGLVIALGADSASVSYTQGVRAGQDILTKLDDFRKYGVELYVDLLLKAIEKQLKADSVTDADMQRYNSEYNELLQRVYDLKVN